MIVTSEPLRVTALSQRLGSLERLIVRGKTKPAPWLLRWLARNFRWVAFPWRVWDYDGDRRWAWVHPFRNWLYAWGATASQRALSGVFLHSIRVDDAELLADPSIALDASMFVDTAFPLRLAAPAGMRITCTLSSVEEPKHVELAAVLYMPDGMRYVLVLSPDPPQDFAS